MKGGCNCTWLNVRYHLLWLKLHTFLYKLYTCYENGFNVFHHITAGINSLICQIITEMLYHLLSHTYTHTHKNFTYPSLALNHL